jgi:hypothetical protein
MLVAFHRLRAGQPHKGGEHRSHKFDYKKAFFSV